MKVHPSLLVIAGLAVGFSVSAGAAEEPWKLPTATGDLHGTLLVPEGADRPTLVFIHPGSGPTDRDGNSAALGGRNDCLKQLAEGLAARGIATLRVDKRGIGASRAAGPAEADLRFETYIDDVAAWSEAMRQSSRFGRLVLGGHSEGAQIVAAAAAAVRPDGVVLLSAAGRPPAAVLRDQLAGRLPPPLAGRAEAILGGLERGETTADVPPPLASLFRPSVQPYLVSWLRHDPAAAVAALGCPVLVVQGEADLQVTPGDGRLLAAASPRVHLVLLEGVNHVLKPVTGDLAAQIPSYRSPEPAVDPRVVESVASFVLQLPDA